MNEVELDPYLPANAAAYGIAFLETSEKSVATRMFLKETLFSNSMVCMLPPSFPFLFIYRSKPLSKR